MKLILYHRKHLKEWTPNPYFPSESEGKQSISGSVFHIHERKVRENVYGQLLIIHANDVKELRKVGGIPLGQIKEHAKVRFGEFIGAIFVTTETGYGYKIHDDETPIFYWDSISVLIDYIESETSVTFESIMETLLAKTRILPTLAILCQGYIAVHAAYGAPDKDWNDEAITLALEQMGWKQLIENSDMSQIVEALRGQHATTENSKDWWQPVLAHVEIPTDEKSQGTKKALIEQLRREWKKDSLPKDVSNLVETIYGSTTHSLTDVSLVARAYLKLAEKLKGDMS